MRVLSEEMEKLLCKNRYKSNGISLIHNALQAGHGKGNAKSLISFRNIDHPLEMHEKPMEFQ